MNLNHVKAGLPVTTNAELGETKGMLISAKNLSLRRPSAQGTVLGHVPGHGGDVWWVEHEKDVVAAYCFDEFEPTGLGPALEHPPLRSLSEVADQHSPEVQSLISGAAEATDYFTEDELEAYAASQHPTLPPAPWTRKGNRLYAADGEEIVVATNASPKYRKVSVETAEAIRVMVNSHDAIVTALADLRTTAKRINNRQHAGIKIDALSWSQLYDASIAADAALALAESEGV